MGMAASQARLISLQARQSNLEYQGQQINQERTILSQQCTALYNSLLDMQVPTPPSTNDFTSVKYEGVNGATKYSFDASSVKPGKDGAYTLTLGTIDYGASLTKNNGYVTTAQGTEVLKYIADSEHVAVEPETEEQDVVYNYDKDELVNLYIVENGVARKVNPNSNADVRYDESTKTYSLYPNKDYFVKSAGGEEEINTPSTNAAGKSDITIAGHQAMTLEYARDNGYITQEQFDGYNNAINNAAISLAGEKAVCEPDDFLIYLDDSGTVHFALASDVGDGSAVTYNFIANGEYTKNTLYENCNLTFDPATGRITAMDIPATTDDKGNPLTFTTISVSAATVTDDNAYQDAYAQYEYEQYLYDKKQQEINAKTEVIQQQDRNLELKLQRLDNERQQIKTEIDAVDKVIDENIEKSYKTFSG